MNKILALMFSFFIFSSLISSAELVRDSFIEETLSTKKFKSPDIVTDYNYSNPDCVRIPLKISERITTYKFNKAYEGQPLKFTVSENVYYNDELLVKKGTEASAKIEIITTRGFAGIPAEIFISNFDISGLDKNKILEPVSKRGFSMTTLILPIKWALTPFPPLGSFTNIIVGTNAVLAPRDTIYIEYYPNF